jgi:CPA2 family monovalent cation:H+ antiporter-2
MSTRLCLKRALELSPDLDVVVRAGQDKDIELLYQLGAREVVQPEFEASLELSSHLLTSIGVPLPAVQQEVAGIRSSHYLDLRPERPSYEVSRDLQTAAQDMSSRWYNLPERSPLVGMTLQETDLRRLIGVSLIAIRRSNGEQIDYPNPQTEIRADDRLLLVGEAEELAAFDDLARGEAPVPTKNLSCQWLIVPSGSPVLGKTFKDLNLMLEYDVQVQALRREGRFIQFPDGTVDVQAGDRLLLCGSTADLNRVNQLVAPLAVLPQLQVPIVSVPISEMMQEYVPMESRRELDS